MLLSTLLLSAGLGLALGEEVTITEKTYVMIMISTLISKKGNVMIAMPR